DIQAAVGREQLKRLPAIVERRRFLAARYQRLLADVGEVITPAEPAFGRSNWQSYCVRLPESVDQRRVMQAMLDRGVSTRRGIMCAHRERAYASAGLWTCGHPGCAAAACPHLKESERAHGGTMILP